MYVSQIANRITFKIKTGYHLKLLTPETIKLLGSTKSKITKNNNAENASHLEITEITVVHFNIVTNDYQQESCIHLISNKPSGQLVNISPKNFILFKSFTLEFSHMRYGLLIEILNL